MREQLRWHHALLLGIPVAFALHLMHASPLIVFPTAAIALIPGAQLMSDATDELADRAGPGIGGLLNVTFGNGPELLLAFFSLLEGLHEVVKASLVGSIVGNTLLVLGASQVVGGWGRERQRFDRTVVQAYAGMLLLAVAALLLPTLMQLAEGQPLPGVGDVAIDFDPDVEALSVAVAVVLILSYAAGMVFSLRTHQDFFNPRESKGEAAAGGGSERPSTRSSVIRLAIAGVLVGVASEVMIGTITETAAVVGVSEFFLGIVVLAVVGNAAEHWVAVKAAAEDRMHLSITIALGSAAQVALFVTPVLVLLSFVLPHPMPFVLNVYEVGALLFAVLVANYLTVEGESNWFEGVQLLALYGALVAVFLIA